MLQTFLDHVATRWLTWRRQKHLAIDGPGLETLLDTLPLGIVLLDKKGRIEYANDGFREIFGYGLAATRGHKLDRLIAPEEEQAEADRLTELALEGKVAVDAARRASDGGTRHVAIRAAPYGAGLVGFYIDRTQEHQEQHYAMVGRLAGVLGHNMNNLLAAAFMGMDLGSRTGLKTVGESLNRMEALVSLLSDYAGHAPINPQTYSMRTLLEDLGPRYEDPALEAQQVRTDREAFSRILNNLDAGNATLSVAEEASWIRCTLAFEEPLPKQPFMIALNDHKVSTRDFQAPAAYGLARRLGHRLTATPHTYILMVQPLANQP